MRITSKGQVTIPIEVRQKAGLLPDTEVEFVVRGNTVIVKKAEKTPRRGRRLLTIMRGKATKRLGTDEIMALTRGN
jgi:antitoxin PrlF